MLWVETAERLKQELTDKSVVVMDGVPELKRFAGRTGTVKTVNMNGRALVQFEAPADISWYDIDPTYLTVVDTPLAKTPAEAAPAKAAASETPAAAKPAIKAKGALSPLELARQQGAAGSAPAKPATQAPNTGQKLSPLELARQQGAAKGGAAAPVEAASQGAAPASPAPKAAPEHKLSPLELARMQGAAKSSAAAPSNSDAQGTAAPEIAPEAAPEVGAQPSAEKTSAPKADTAGMSPLELARLQGPFKG